MVDEAAEKTEAPEEMQAVETPANAETTPNPDSPESVDSDGADLDPTPGEKTVPESVLVYNKQKLKEKIKANEAESAQTIEAKDHEIQLLKLRLEQATATESAEPTMPTLESCDYDESVYQQKVVEYNQYVVNKTLDQRLGERDQRNQKQTVAQRRSEAFDEQLEAHGKQASELRIESYDEALSGFFRNFGEASAQAMITDGLVSAVTVNYLHKNPEKAQELAAKANSGHALAAVKELVELNSSLIPDQESDKSIPAPVDRPEGGRSGGNSFQVRADKIRANRDPETNMYSLKELAALKKEAKAAGVTIE